MKIWEKKEIAREVVKEIHDTYGCDTLTASILARRNITSGSELLYFLEEDSRYLHNPFNFAAMEDAVDRIYDAAEEGEKVLIFGDRDADGITSTTILCETFREMGIDVTWRIPRGDESYGLSIEAVDDFAAKDGTLIVTVDCGITNNEEIAHAAGLGIDVIVIDHHLPGEELPVPAIIINPKVSSCQYPFAHLCGCGVAYKVISALRFARNELYKQQICLLNVRPINDAYIVEGIKIVNLREIERISETVVPGLVSISQTRLLPFLTGQQIFVWDEPLQRKQLAKIFGSGVEFNMLDIRPEIAKVIPSVANMSLLRLAPLSTIGKYSNKSSSELDGFFNIFVTFVLKKISLYSPRDEQDLQLVMLATLADLMPLVDENRILVRLGLNSLNKGKIHSGLQELMARQGLLGKHLGTYEIAWNLTPVLNAAGRMGKPELAIELFLEPDSEKRSRLADQLVQFNKDRRQLGLDLWPLVEQQAYESLPAFNGNLVIASDAKIHRGVTGILATKLVQHFNVPAIVISHIDDQTASGSVRSTRGYDVSPLLEACSDLFIKHGGHNYAAGFSLNISNIEALRQRIAQYSATIEFTESADEEKFIIDAELPGAYITGDLLKIVDRFEPYGENNPQLLFMAKGLKIIDASIMGKTDAKHLKLTLDCGKHKWPALYWNAADKLKRDFDIGDKIDLVFQVGRNTYNGVETAQMVVSDLKKSEN